LSPLSTRGRARATSETQSRIEIWEAPGLRPGLPVLDQNLLSTNGTGEGARITNYFPSSVWDLAFGPRSKTLPAALGLEGWRSPAAAEVTLDLVSSDYCFPIKDLQPAKGVSGVTTSQHRFCDAGFATFSRPGGLRREIIAFCYRSLAVRLLSAVRSLLSLNNGRGEGARVTIYAASSASSANSLTLPTGSPAALDRKPDPRKIAVLAGKEKKLTHPLAILVSDNGH
jgi:hypothetical protein